MPRTAKPKLEGQEKIQQALEEKNPIKLWKLVMFLGYKKIPSINERKLIFFQAYNSFNPEINNNFVAYYDKCLHYAGINNYNRTANPLTTNMRAKQHYYEKNFWPTTDNQDCLNQSENILEHFIF